MESEVEVVEEVKPQELVVINDGVAILNSYVAYQLAMAEIQINEMKKFQEDYKNKILEIMEEKGIQKVHSKDIEITYTNPSTRETFDTKKFKEEHLDLYNEYIKSSPVKGSVKLKCLSENTK